MRHIMARSFLARPWDMAPGLSVSLSLDGSQQLQFVDEHESNADGRYKLQQEDDEAVDAQVQGASVGQFFAHDFLVEEPSGEEGDENITERYIVAASEIAAIPLPGTAYSNTEHEFFNMFSGLRLRSRTVRAMTGGKTYEVVLVYAYPPGMAPLGDTEVYESVEYSTREFSAPLNQHPDYRYNWDHKLLAAEGVVSSPSWWSTAVDDRMKEEEARQWRWARPDESVPDQWRVLLPEEKPGITS